MDTEKQASPAQRRFSTAGAVPVDQHTRRGDHDVMDGHMAFLDLSDPATLEAVTTAHGGTLAAGEGRHGVYVEPTEVAEDGYPVLALVILRDSSAARVVVPYAALSAVPAGMKVR